jgi:chloramphenicol 3-O-phosphotransferase
VTWQEEFSPLVSALAERERALNVLANNRADAGDHDDADAAGAAAGVLADCRATIDAMRRIVVNVEMRVARSEVWRRANR